DEGLNTGGMGAVAPNPYYTPELAELCMKTIFLPSMEAMNAEGRTFKGCLYFGLMLTHAGPKVIEYNCRFGDPETQVVLPLLQSDLFTILRAVREQKLAETEVRFSQGAAACIVLASGGYPQKYATGKTIHGLANGAVPQEDVVVYHAGTAREGDELVTAGGRVLGVCATAPTLQRALETAYAGANKISFEGGYKRKDIGQRALKAL
ncbi:MAG: phosphoribosylglycinamide synthetase C domain-containing protein, partial [Pygmaiobacter sp.]